jgi:hypothetical protein
VQDGILNLAGADWLTIDGLTLADGNTVNPETMEYGIGLFKAGVSDGCQNNTIKNCSITLKQNKQCSRNGSGYRRLQRNKYSKLDCNCADN